MKALIPLKTWEDESRRVELMKEVRLRLWVARIWFS